MINEHTFNKRISTISNLVDGLEIDANELESRLPGIDKRTSYYKDLKSDIAKIRKEIKGLQTAKLIMLGIDY